MESALLPGTVPFVNNRHNVYIPLLLCCGVTVNVRLERIFFCDPCLLSTVLTTLQEDAAACIRLLPRSVHALIRRTKIWVNGDNYRIGEWRNPRILNHMTTHHYEGWLDWARDRRDKALGIEIYNARQYLRMRRHWNDAGGLLLHEFCHLIHQQVFGLDCLRIQRLFAVAASSDRYASVPRRDWAGKKRTTDMAYCLVDHKEFFAELSVTYWSRGYRELDSASRDDIMICSPPFRDEVVVERVRAAGLRGRDATTPPPAAPVGMAAPTTTTHCNKFYPFTSGQFRHCDPEMYQEFHALWQMIEDWSDPRISTKQQDDGRRCCYPCTIFSVGLSRESLLVSPLPDQKSLDQQTSSEVDTTIIAPIHPTTQSQILDTVDL